MSDYKFRFVEDFEDLYESSLLETNLISFLNWGFLESGAYDNVDLNDTSCGGTALKSKLIPFRDKRFTDGRVWNGFRSDWVWESGSTHVPNPTLISGIYVNSTFYPPTTTGTYAYYINYPLGQVYFNTAIPTGSNVQVEFSYRKVQVRSADESWFQALMLRSFNADDAQSIGAIKDILPQNRIQLPAIVVESVGNARAIPNEIGSNGRIQNLDVNFFILSESTEDRKRLHDILINQWDREIKTFNANEIIYPLNALGSPVSGAKNYTQLCESNPWALLRWVKVRSGESNQMGENLWWMSVRGTFEFDIV